MIMALKGKSIMTFGAIKKFLSNNSLLLIVVLLFAFTSAYNSSFLTTINLSGMLIQISYMTFLAMGLTFVILTGGIDLSIGAISSLSTVIIAYSMKNFFLVNNTVTLVVGILLVMLVCFLIGLLNGIFIADFNFPPIIVTLCMTWIATGLGNTIIRGTPLALKIPDFRRFLAIKIAGVIPITFIITLAVLVILIWVLNKTRFGREFYAVGSSHYAAFISGMNVKMVLRKAYIISAMFAGVAGLFLAANVNSGYATAAQNWELYSIAAVVMGGVSLSGGEGSILKVFFGVIILRILNKLVVFTGLSNISGFIEGIIIGTILVLVLFVNSIKKERD